MNTPRKILIIQTAFLGDVILATSMLEKLYAENNAIELHFLLKKGNESVLENHPFLKKLWVFDKKNKLSNLLKLSVALRKEKFDLVVNLHRFATSGILAAATGATHIHGFDKNPLSFLYTKKYPHTIADGTHEISRNFSLIKDFVSGGVARTRLYPSERDKQEIKPFQDKPYVTVAPSSIWYTKQYPEQKWIELINRLQGVQIYLLGAATDNALCERIIAKARGINLAGKLNILQSAALMQNARMNYVNDSAPMHLASATNAPVTAVYCSTVPEFGFGPLSDNAIVVQTSEKLPCRPCGLHGHKSCPEGHFKCADFVIN